VEFGHSGQDLEDHRSHQVIRTISLNLYYQSMLKGIKSHDLSVMSKWFKSHLRKFIIQRIKKNQGITCLRQIENNGCWK
jgi:hypothetical protein